ncbi:MAG: ABC transporter transmembrane domain-containing protein [Phycisphaerales bacterium]
MEPERTATSAPTPGGRADAAHGITQTRLVLELLRPYRGWLVVILLAMLVETAMSLAAPWPLKLVLDSVLGDHAPPRWLDDFHRSVLGGSRLWLAALAGAATVAIAIAGAIATYVDNYYTESVGQWVAHDLRLRVYDHLQRLSLTYYDTHQSGDLLSTITDDVATIQDFASSSTLDILVDILTILGMLVVMFWLNWDFALIAVAVTPFLLLFVARFRRVVKQATHEVRKRQSDIVSVVQEGLQSVRVVKAFGREDLEQAHLGAASRATVDAALKARRIKSLLSPVVTVVVAVCTGFVLWRGTALILAGTMTIGSLTVFLAYLGKFFKPVQDLAKMTNTVAQAAVGIDRIRAILETDMRVPERPDAREAAALKGAVVFEHVAFAYDSAAPVLRDVSFEVAPGQSVGIVGPTGGGKSTVVSLIPASTTPSRGASCRWQRRGATSRSIPAPPDRLRAPGHGPLPRHHPREHRLRALRRHQRGDRRRGHCARQRRRVHRGSPRGYDTIVGEPRHDPLRGQRQAHRDARAIIRDAPILILDEPTARSTPSRSSLSLRAREAYRRAGP